MLCARGTLVYNICVYSLWQRWVIGHAASKQKIPKIL